LCWIKQFTVSGLGKERSDAVDRICRLVDEAQALIRLREPAGIWDIIDVNDPDEVSRIANTEAGSFHSMLACIAIHS
jgi:hypothetical protein